MRTPVRPLLGAALCLATLLPATRAADEAVLPDGERRPGVLTFAGGRLHFQPAGSQAPLALADLHAVRFAAGPLPPLLAARVHRVVLPHGQILTGQLLGLDRERLRLRTVWAEDLTVPRPAVAAVLQLPGWETFFAADFGPDLNGWQATGTPALGTERSPAGRHCLVLNRPGQAVTHTLDTPVEAGWFAADFRAAGEGTGARWLAEAEFRGPDGPRTVRMTLAGPGDRYEAEVPGIEGTGYPLTRGPGWHRLRLDFAPDRLALTIDDTALWSSEGRGPGGPLRQVRLTCVEAPRPGRGGEMTFADVSLARVLPELPHPPGDPRQDEVWLVSGDQLFGRVPRADGDRALVAGAFGERALPWGEVRGLFLRHEQPAPRAAGGERVRVWLRPGAGQQLDELEGAVLGLDESRLTLDHALLGECKIDRARIARLSATKSDLKEKNP
jgi:hypothetical protein